MILRFVTPPKLRKKRRHLKQLACHQSYKTLDSPLRYVFFRRSKCNTKLILSLIPHLADDPLESNPFTLPTIAPGTQVQISAVAHASFLQEVLVIGQPSGQGIVFTGSGEDVPMIIFGTSPSETILTIPPAEDSYALSLEFVFSSDGGVTFQLSMVVEVTFSGFLFQFFTEDSTDNDENDTIMTVVLNTS